MPRKIRRFLPVAVAAALATSGFAYMATNTVDPSNAGLGSQTISGYDVHNIKYTSDNAATNPKITAVSFTLTNEGAGKTAPSAAYAELNGVQSTACTVSSGTWSCAWSAGQDLTGATSLTVLAYQ